MDRLLDLVRRVVAKLSASEWVMVLVVRLSIGLVFFDSGRNKLMKLDEMAAYFASLGIPLPGFNAVLASATECFGGLLLMLGLGTRFFAFQLAFVMLVAIETAVIQEEHVDGLLKFLYLHEWNFLVVFLWLVVRGAGKASLDHVIAKRLGWAKDDATSVAPPALAAETK